MEQHSNPNALIGHLIEKHGSDEATIRKLFLKTVRAQKSGAYRDAIDQWYFTFQFHRLTSTRSPSPSTTADEVRKSLDKLSAGLLDALVPLVGKALRDCTRADCEQAGGWFQRIAACVPPGQTVGDVLSEEHLRQLVPAAPASRRKNKAPIEESANVE
jgi:hypothetical protein